MTVQDVDIVRKRAVVVMEEGEEDYERTMLTKLTRTTFHYWIMELTSNRDNYFPIIVNYSNKYYIDQRIESDDIGNYFHLLSLPMTMMAMFENSQYIIVRKYSVEYYCSLMCYKFRKLSVENLMYRRVVNDRLDDVLYSRMTANCRDNYHRVNCSDLLDEDQVLNCYWWNRFRWAFEEQLLLSWLYYY